jgi:hypothetical protein
MNTKQCKVKLIWDDGIWRSEAEDESFGVTLESGSLDALIERVKIAVQDILEVDFKYTGDIRFLFQAERVDELVSQRV